MTEIEVAMATLSPELEQEILATIRREASPLLVGKVAFRFDEDWNGDQAIFIDVWYPLDPNAIEAKTMLRVRHAVGQVLLKHGENRFLYVQPNLAHDQKLAAVA